MTEFEAHYRKAIAVVRAFFSAPGAPARSAVARRAGLSINALRHMDEPGWAPTAPTLIAVLNKIDDIKRERKSRPSRSPQRATCTA